MAVRAVNTHDGAVMTIHRRVGSRAPLSGLLLAVLALLLFTDADVQMETTTVARAVQAMTESRLDHLCLIHLVGNFRHHNAEAPTAHFFNLAVGTHHGNRL